MINASLYNATLYNWDIGIGGALDDSISFAWFGLQNTMYSIKSTDWDSIANIEINQFDRPQLDWGFVLSRYYRDRVITMRGTITATSVQALSDAIDNLKWSLDDVEGYLQIKFGTIFRRIKATVSNIDIPRLHYNINNVPFTISFLCKEPFFSSIPMTEVPLLSKTASFQTEVVYDATANSFPIIYLAFNSAASVTSVAVTINGKAVTLATAISAWNYLTFNWETKSVSIGSTAQDYTWVFNPFVTWSNIVIFTINWTYNVDISILYRKLYK